MAFARISLPKGGLYELLCFHAQQVVEKSIKAVLLHEEIVFPYTHDIARLITLVNAENLPWHEKLDQSVDLTKYAIETRYPGVFEPVTEEEYHETIEIAERVLAWAEALLKELEA